MGSKDKEMDRQAYVDLMEAQLKEWKAEIDMLRAKAEQADAQARIEYQNQIESLSSKREAVNQRLQDLKSSGSDAWHDMRDGLEKARTELETALKNATSRFT